MLYNVYTATFWIEDNSQDDKKYILQFLYNLEVKK
jgi:hypothetical protein